MKIQKHIFIYLIIPLLTIILLNGCSDNDEPIYIKPPENKGTYVPDDNFEQKLIELGYDDVLDDYVVTKKLEDVVELDVSNLEIKDLTGIEDFKSLTILKCFYNQLTSLDVSNNLSLTDLNCQVKPTNKFECY